MYRPIGHWSKPAGCRMTGLFSRSILHTHDMMHMKQLVTPHIRNMPSTVAICHQCESSTARVKTKFSICNAWVLKNPGGSDIKRDVLDMSQLFSSTTCLIKWDTPQFIFSWASSSNLGHISFEWEKVMSQSAAFFFFFFERFFFYKCFRMLSFTILYKIKKSKLESPPPTPKKRK